jgi:ornithine cyclodeaminase/alanine dehydrogenase-like protein (mu-crystallin family)
MIPHLTAAQLRTALPYPQLIDALRQAFTASIQAPRRHVHAVSDTSDTVLLMMPVWQPAGHLGVKLVTVAPKNPERQLPSVHAIFVLFDTETGQPLALMDGEELTSRRTAAASALASTYLSRADSSSLLMVGTGSLSPYLAAAHCVARPIKRLRVWGRSAEKAGQTVRRLADHGLPAGVEISVASDLQAAVREADIISCATTSTVPIVLGDWVRPGTHLDLVGGFKPNMREVDDALMSKATVFVDTFAGALTEAGDLVQPMASGQLKREAIEAELAELCGERHKGRTEASSITVFKSVGTGIEDLCAADVAWAALSD